MRSTPVLRLLNWLAAVMLLGQPAAWSCPCALRLHPHEATKPERSSAIVVPQAAGDGQSSSLPACCRRNRAGSSVQAATSRCGTCCSWACGQCAGGCSACKGSGKRCECGVRASPAVVSASESVTLVKPVAVGLAATAVGGAGDDSLITSAVWWGPDPPCPATALAFLCRLCRFLL